MDRFERALETLRSVKKRAVEHSADADCNMGLISKSTRIERGARVEALREAILILETTPE